MWTDTRYADNRGVQLAYDQLEDNGSGTPLLLVMGLATARTWWPDGLCRAFADAGFSVARYDQRDAGQSTRMPPTARSNPLAALFGKPPEQVAYTSEDMTDDAIAVMGELGWKRAYIFGHSMGGLVAQRIALRYPDRVLGVVSSAALPSDVTGISVARYLRVGLLAKLARTKFPEGREGDIEAGMAVARGVASPGYPFDEQRTRAWISADADIGPRDNQAQSRQIGATWHGPALRELRAPTLVLHGEQDQLLRPSAAARTARTVDGARLRVFPGVGHDIPEALWRTYAEEVRALAADGVTHRHV
ncbi:alpha/beta fold hydrolase [Nocardia callitridis]|uniref:Alpha/beta hydrolase n=1 Tax=Nocardia callitridis TaxID=648753 RepID=A0ABP9KGI1_9NOCA